MLAILVRGARRCFSATSISPAIAEIGARSSCDASDGEAAVRFDGAVQPVEHVVERLRHLTDFVLACWRLEPDGELALGDSRGATGDVHDRCERARGQPVA